MKSTGAINANYVVLQNIRTTGGAAFTNIKANFGFSDNCGVLADCSGGASPNGAEAAAFASDLDDFPVQPVNPTIATASAVRNKVLFEI